jgi:methionyl-tRNA formyltransferase
MRLVFAGTPSVALPSLRALEASDHEVVAVVTRPDAPSGRGRHTTRSPVKEWAEECEVECLQPERASDPDFVARLQAIAPDCCPVVAYGTLLPPAVLDIPAHGWCNLHFSVLPRWRGAAPVQHALIAGDDITGATTFRIVPALDAGPIYGFTTETVRPDDTAGTLLDRLAATSTRLLVSTLDGIESGEVRAEEQPTEGVTFAPKLTVADAHVDWTAPAFAIERRIRACTPEPGAWTLAGAVRLKLGPVRIRRDAPSLPPGALLVRQHDVLVGTATHPVALGTVQPSGKPRMPGADWARGVRNRLDRFSSR